MEENQPSDVAIELIAIKTITAFIGVMGRIIRLRNRLIILYKSSRVKRLTLVELLSLLGVFGSCQKKLFTHFSLCVCASSCAFDFCFCSAWAREGKKRLVCTPAFHRSRLLCPCCAAAGKKERKGMKATEERISRNKREAVRAEYTGEGHLKKAWACLWDVCASSTFSFRLSLPCPFIRLFGPFGSRLEILEPRPSQGIEKEEEEEEEERRKGSKGCWKRKEKIQNNQ